MQRALYQAIAFLAVCALLFSGGGTVIAANLNANIYSPNFVSYQGYVTVSGSPYNGTGYFKFAVVNAAGNITYWSNNGSSAGAGEPTVAVSLTVTNGLFNVLLGDSPMVPIQATVFQSPDRLLRVWFSATGAGGSFTRLIPDRKIAAVPYAYIAEEAVNADALGGLHSYDFALANVEPRPGFLISSVDTSSGGSISTVIGADGLALISYYDAVNGKLVVAHCMDVACTAAPISMLDLGSSNVGSYSSITIGADDLGLISYYDIANGDLKVAHCEDTACTSASVYTLDSTNNVGQHTSITIGVDGLGLISYYDVTNSSLKVAHCSNLACSSASPYTLDSTGDVGQFTSIAITSNGTGIIAYFDATLLTFKTVACYNVVCSSYGAPVTLYSTPYGGGSISMTIGADGLPLIAFSYSTYADAYVAVAHCVNEYCTGTPDINAVYFGLETVVYGVLITIGQDGLALVAFRDHYDGGMAAHCANLDCSVSSLARLGAGVSWNYGAVTVGVDGMPLLAYKDLATNYLKVLHFSNTLGIPYNRRR